MVYDKQPVPAKHSTDCPFRLGWVWDGNPGSCRDSLRVPDVVTNAMTAVVLVLGQRHGRGIANSGSAGEWRWTFLLPVLYALGAVAVGLTST